MGERDRTIELPLPSKVTALVYESTSEPGTWVISVHVEALDVETKQPGIFATTWRGADEPTDSDVAEAMIEMLAHEIREQLGLDPHDRNSVDAGSDTLRRIDGVIVDRDTNPLDVMYDLLTSKQ